MLRMIMSPVILAGDENNYLEIEVDTTKSTSLEFTTRKTSAVNYGFTEGDLTESVILPANTAVSKTIPSGTTKIFIKVDKVPDFNFLRLNSPMITKVKNWSGYHLPNLRLTSSNLVEVPETLWDNCTDMGYMFHSCTKFNQLLNFDTSNVVGMSSMFQSCINFNQPVNFDTSNVTNMLSMFSGCSKFNSNITFNSVKSVRTINYMFQSCSVFNRTLYYLNFKSSVSRTSYDAGATAWATSNKPRFTAL